MSDEIYVNQYASKNGFSRYSVVVFGFEYAFGCDGVRRREQGAYGKSLPRKKYYQGESVRSQQAFENVFLERPDCKGFAYNVLTHNCYHFAKTAVNYLKGDVDFVGETLNVLSVINPFTHIVNFLGALTNLKCS